ncbi:MAG: hypothetical protein IKS90_01660 [Clostridia bacterium]|nr:hypothetical protein [Clostridia bacterium]
MHISAKRKKALIRLCLAFIIATAFLTVFSKSSFLYPMNDWVDVNCFMTMGASVFDGKVMYKDLYEQKGPLLYFAYAFATFVSPTSYIGAYILEVVCFTFFLFYSLKLIELFTGELDTRFSIGTMAALALAVTVAPAFAHGGSVEEMSLFMIAYSLYHLLRAVRSGNPIGLWRVFMMGAYAAAALWTKFTILGFYFGLCLFIFFHYMRDGKKRKRLVAAAACFLAGMIVMSSPIIAYFAANGALKDLYIVYFYNNIFIYSTASGYGPLMTVYGVIRNIAVGFLESMVLDAPCTFLLLIGACYLTKERKRLGSEASAVLTCFVSLSVFTFIGGIWNAVYYGLILCGFAGFGAAGAIMLFDLRRRIPEFLTNKKGKLKLTGIISAILVAAFFLSGNTYLLRYRKWDLPQYKFEAIISRKENPTLLNYGFLDAGFYRVADIKPQNRFFCKLNIVLPEMMQEQNDIVENHKVDFVVTRGKRLEEYAVDCSAYRCVCQATFRFELHKFTYYLYILNEEFEGIETP